ncbi:MAG: HAD-IB family phosphatase [Clostridia bacterium]|nr:HAD-IB family phosphatase [Clostridia bacterium]
MNVYDFDNTIYDGESVVDFYFFILKKNPRLISIMPKMLQMLIRYKACRISTAELLETAERYAEKILPGLNLDGAVRQFWDKNQKKIKKFYLKNQKEDDVILSASCSFLIEEMCKRLGIRHVIASEVDIKSGKVIRLCFRGNKAEIFRSHFPDAQIDGFYTDSMNDKPMFDLAKNVYIVKGDNVKELII